MSEQKNLFQTGEESANNKKGGMPLNRRFECMSALQKFVRRGEELDALRTFFELADNVDKACATMAFNRVRIIAYEDIGPGDPPALMFALRANDDAREMYGKHGWRLAATSAVIALCRATKSRLSGHAMAVARGRNHEGFLEFPEYCYDQHTRKGKQMGRGIDHFRTEGAKLDRVDTERCPDPYEDEAFQYIADGRLKQK